MKVRLAGHGLRTGGRYSPLRGSPVDAREGRGEDGPHEVGARFRLPPKRAEPPAPLLGARSAGDSVKTAIRPQPGVTGRFA